MITTDYIPPDHRMGQIVLWYPNGDRQEQPLPALVVGRAGRRVNLLFFESSRHVHGSKNGVLHLDDPALQEGHYDRGGWDHTPDTKLVRRLALILAEADEALAEDLHDPLPRETFESLTDELCRAGRPVLAHWGHAEMAQAVAKLRNAK